MAMAALTSCAHALPTARLSPPQKLFHSPVSSSSSSSSSSSLSLLPPSPAAWTHSQTLKLKRRCPLPPRAKMWGEDPEWSDEDYIVLGLGHCFLKNDDDKLVDHFVIEPIPAGGLECMENGGRTCYKHATATTLGIVLKHDVALLPPEFRGAQFAENFDYRAKCASRTWKREHPQQNLLHLVPKEGVRSDFNFNLEDKRILNQEVVVTDADNIKQDMSIDVYGRAKEETVEELDSQVSSLYNV